MTTPGDVIEQLTITAMGRQPLRSKLEAAILGALKNLSLDSSDEKRALFAVSAVMCCGKFETFSDHGSWKQGPTQ